MIAYQDPEHKGNSAAYHSGKPCREKGCKEPAGTAWSSLWCYKHNVERMDRISASLDGMIERARFSEAVQTAIAQDRQFLLDAYATQHALIIAAGGKITVLPEHWRAKITYQGTHTPKGKDGPMVYEIGIENFEEAPRMKLIDLSPRWISHDDNAKAALIFKCPHCREVWLTCTFQPIKMSTQMELYRPEGEASGGQVVPSRQDFAWGRNGESFHTLSVTPSVDASASGHWHGFITDGECR